jgi:hypothetical protein
MANRKKKPPVPTKFARDFEHDLLRNPNPKLKYQWPSFPGNPHPPAPANNFRDIGDAIMVLGVYATGLVESVNGRTFHDQVVAWVKTHPWPKDKQLPAAYRNVKFEQPVRLAIICNIVHRMIEAVNAAGGSGSGDPMPPHHL